MKILFVNFMAIEENNIRVRLDRSVDLFFINDEYDAIEYLKTNSIDICFAKDVAIDKELLVKLINLVSNTEIVLLLNNSEELIDIDDAIILYDTIGNIEVISYVYNTFSKKHVYDVFDSTRRIKIDRKRLIVYFDGNIVKLSKKVYDLLNVFIDNENKVLSRIEIEKKLWGNCIENSDSRTIDIYVLNLRKIFGNNVISTVRGKGYEWTGL